MHICAYICIYSMCCLFSILYKLSQYDERLINAEISDEDMHMGYYVIEMP